MRKEDSTKYMRRHFHIKSTRWAEGGIKLMRLEVACHMGCREKMQIDLTERLVELRTPEGRREESWKRDGRLGYVRTVSSLMSFILGAHTSRSISHDTSIEILHRHFRRFLADAPVTSLFNRQQQSLDDTELMDEMKVVVKRARRASATFHIALYQRYIPLHEGELPAFALLYASPLAVHGFQVPRHFATSTSTLSHEGALEIGRKVRRGEDGEDVVASLNGHVTDGDCFNSSSTTTRPRQNSGKNLRGRMKVYYGDGRISGWVGSRGWRMKRRVAFGRRIDSFLRRQQYGSIGYVSPVTRDRTMLNTLVSTRESMRTACAAPDR
ncbi:hypothetical protein SCHPADRAFT_989933 [Schizopora paradoxa]|uniref:Uncharacterized protein n=1 Tax=Schizopora paradoxa TaxID=27342 RepID=A0A0H2R3Z2_9AGAM|nr:hypothetical protein SCHPADRAFT_989933 [Schizopora paradoxa]